MDNNPIPDAAQQCNSLPPITSFINAEQIPRLPQFSENQEDIYFEGTRKLSKTIEPPPTGSESYQPAYKRLFEVSLNIRAKVNKNRQPAMVLQQRETK